MEESILATIKKMLGFSENYAPFDTDIIVLINGALMTLQQYGVGPSTGFVLTGYDQEWNEFLPSETLLEGAKQYIYLQVKMVFDPPANSFVMTAMEKQSEKLEWRLREQAEFYASGTLGPGYWQKIDASGDEHDEHGDDGEPSEGQAITNDEIDDITGLKGD